MPNLKEPFVLSLRWLAPSSSLLVFLGIFGKPLLNTPFGFETGLNLSHHNSSPFELFWNVKPDLCHLHPFGCLALALIPKDKQKKTFDSKVKNSVFIGFPRQHDGFLLFDLTTKTEFVSCDVHFYNDQFPCQKDINFQPSLPKVDSHQHSSSSSDTPSTPDEDTSTQPDEETLEESQPSSPKPPSSSNNQPPTHQYSL